VLFDLAPSYFVCDLKGTLIDCNQSFERLTGGARRSCPAEAVGPGPVPMDQAPGLTACCRRTLRRRGGPRSS